MAPVPLIACDALVGLPRIPFRGFTPDVTDLLAQMRRTGVQRAAVRHRSALDAGPDAGNPVVCAETATSESLLPSWFLTPDGSAPDFDPHAAVSRMLEAGVRMAWTDPKAEQFSLLPWCAGPLYETLCRFRVPLLLEFDAAPPEVLDTVLGDFPALRVILLGAPRLGRHRMLYPLFRRHPALMMAVGFSYSVHLGIEDLCNAFGSHRWVLSTGYPEAEMGAGVAALMYAGVDSAAKEAIGWKNIERLLAEVRS